MNKRLIILILLLLFAISAYAATRNIVPRADDEGKIGTSTLRWSEGHFDELSFEQQDNKYYADASETDQGAVGDGKSINALVDDIGTSKSAALVLAHTSTGNTTTYTLTTSETIPSNIALVIENGAILDGAGTLSLKGPFKAGLCQCFGSSITIDPNGTMIDKVYPQWFGAVGDGSTDDAPEIQKAMEMAAGCGAQIVIPLTDNGTYIIGEQASTYCLQVPSNTNMLIEPGVTLETDANIGVSVRFIDIYPTKNNVTIIGYGATIDGKKEEYVSGEDRHGIRIGGSTNITIKGLTIQDTGGDGVYVGGGSTEGVLLENITCDNCRRQGISITSGRNVIVDRCNFNNTDGTSPEAGVDLEPNNNNNFLENIVFRDCKTSGNDGVGYNVTLYKLGGDNPKDVSVVFENCVDTNSVGGFYMGTFYEDGNEVVSGYVEFDRCTSINAGLGGFNIRNYGIGGPQVLINRGVVIDCDQNENGNDKSASPFSVFRESSDSGPTTIGNVRIVEPYIEYTYEDSNDRPDNVDYYFRDLTGAEVADIELINPQRLGHGGANYFMNVAGEVHVEDELELMKQHSTKTIYRYYAARHFDNQGAAATYTFDDSIPAGSMDQTFHVVYNAFLTIIPDPNSIINPYGVANGKYMRCKNIGSSVTLERTSTTVWTIKDIVGEWYFEDRAPNYAVDTSANDSYTATIYPTLGAYYTGLSLYIDANTPNTGACTLNIGALGAKSIKMLHDQDPGNNCIEEGSIFHVVYDGTNFQLMNPCAN